VTNTFKKSLTEFMPALISVLLFSVLFVGASGQVSLFKKLMLGSVVVIGLLMLIFSKVQQGFGQRLFNASLLVALSFSAVHTVSMQVFNSFNPSALTGHFIVDKLLYNFLHTQWSSLFGIILTYLVVFIAFNFFTAKRLTNSL
jgi:hypothetical protein